MRNSKKRLIDAARFEHSFFDKFRQRRLRREIDGITARIQSSQCYNERQSKLDQESLDDLSIAIWLIETRRLQRLIWKYDIHVGVNDESWWSSSSDGYRFLNGVGRQMYRRAIDEEIMRRRDAGAWWWKNVLTPALSALTGLLGALIGLIAVLNHK